MTRFLLFALLLGLIACKKDDEPFYTGRRGPLVATLEQGDYKTEYTYDQAGRIIGIRKELNISWIIGSPEATIHTISYNGGQVEIDTKQLLLDMSSGKTFEKYTRHITLQLNMLGRVISGSYRQTKFDRTDPEHPDVTYPGTGEISVTYDGRGQLETYSDKLVETVTRYTDEPPTSYNIITDYRQKYTWLEGTIATTTSVCETRLESGTILSEITNSARWTYFAQPNTTNSDFDIIYFEHSQGAALFSQLGLLGNICPYVPKIAEYNQIFTTQFNYGLNEAGQIEWVRRDGAQSWIFNYYN